MTTSYCNSFLFRALSCLISLQLLVALPVQAAQETHLSKLTIETTGLELEKMMDLSVRIMVNKELYKLINDTFGPLLETPTNEKPRVSQSKIIFLLSQVKKDWIAIEKYLDKVPEEKVTDPEIKVIHERFRKLFNDVIKDKKLIELIKTNLATNQPIRIVDKKHSLSYDDMEFYANHPRKELTRNGTVKTIPADDHRQVMIDLVNSAKPGDILHFNFYDLDLLDLAEAFIQAHKRGVKVLGGVDKGVVESKPAAQEVFKKLKAAGVYVEAVDSVGLNHQKIIALQSAHGTSKTILSSGNPTQSCSGPEGDLPEVPADIRPKESIPNPNNMIVVEGEIPAIIAVAEIRKNIIYKLRGQSEFPISGAYQLLGPKRPGYQYHDWMLMAFSPNGGLGDINRDIFARVFRASSGPISGAFFSFSSEELALELTQKIVQEIKFRRKEKRSMKDLVKLVGDTRFAMRDFSMLLRLSGYRLVEFDPADPTQLVTGQNNSIKDPEEFDQGIKKEKNKKVYIEDLNDPISKPIRDLLSPKEFEEFRKGIRVTNKSFKESSFEYNGKKITYEVKLHHKLFAIGAVTDAGTSINFSNAGKTNQEQIVIVFSEYIAKKAAEAIDYVFESFSDTSYSIKEEVARRNRFNTPTEIKLGLKLFEKQAREQKKQSPETKSFRALTCPAVFTN